MVYLMVFGLTVLMIINLILFHTVFTVFYFDFGRGIIGEILWGYVVAGFGVILVMAVGTKILAALGGVLKFLGKVLGVVLIVAAVLGVIFVVYCVVDSIIGKRRKHKAADKEENR